MNFLLIDDHPVPLMGLEMAVKENFTNANVHMASDGQEAMEALKHTDFDICLLDIILPNTDTHALLLHLQKRQPKCKVLVYTNNPDEAYAMNYISMGASGYLNKNSTYANLILAIRLVLQGNIFIAENVIRANLAATSQENCIKQPLNNLTRREIEVLNHILLEQSNKQISAILHVNQSTVSTLKGRIMRKLNASNLVELLNIVKANNLK